MLLIHWHRSQVRYTYGNAPLTEYQIQLCGTGDASADILGDKEDGHIRWRIAGFANHAER